MYPLSHETVQLARDPQIRSRAAGLMAVLSQLLGRSAPLAESELSCQQRAFGPPPMSLPPGRIGLEQRPLYHRWDYHRR